jgi:C-methyltransferase C-terminal domain/Putative zinc binding domain/Methyltransferase domain
MWNDDYTLLREAGAMHEITLLPNPLDYDASGSKMAAPLSSCISSNHPCRVCGMPLSRTFANLGTSPLANAFIHPDRADRMEPFHPLHAFVCDTCFLVQLRQYETPEAIFGDYAYFSSYSESWLRHAADFAVKMVGRFGFGPASLVVEVASNDGYLLQYFRERGIPVLGVEPAANVARIAAKKGIPSEIAFFGAATARRLRDAGCAPDLMVANNVLAHVPELHDFVEGFQILLASDGIATFEFPHLLRLIEHNQFDTIYHEHFSYFSLSVVEKLFAQHGLTLFDVEELPTHGGSLRIFLRHTANATIAVGPAVAALRRQEQSFGLGQPETYAAFAERIVAIKCALLDFLITARRRGESVVAYGAPAKGNTLLNYCGVGPELVAFTVDRSPHKQGLLLPGTRIPIRAPEAIEAAAPDYVLILPWNLRTEITEQCGFIRRWGGRFVVPIPALEVF